MGKNKIKSKSLPLFSPLNNLVIPSKRKVILFLTINKNEYL